MQQWSTESRANLRAGIFMCLLESQLVRPQLWLQLEHLLNIYCGVILCGSEYWQTE